MNLTDPTFWVILGLVLITVELVTSSFILLFFGFSALLVAAAQGLGFRNIAGDLVLFALSGLAGVFFFRPKLKSAFRVKDNLSIDENTTLILNKDVEARGRSDIEYQGTTWTAVNDSDVNLKKGEKVVILKTDGVKLIIAPIQ